MIKPKFQKSENYPTSTRDKDCKTKGTKTLKEKLKMIKKKLNNAEKLVKNILLFKAFLSCLH